LADINRSLEQRTAELISSSLKISQEKPAKQTKSGAESATDSSLEDQLAKAKASRNQAESARQKIANEILEATKEVCQKLIKDGEQTLEKAKKLEAEAQQKQREAKAELEKAQAIRAEAETYAERLKSEAQRRFRRSWSRPREFGQKPTLTEKRSWPRCSNKPKSNWTRLRISATRPTLTERRSLPRPKNKVRKSCIWPVPQQSKSATR
jgi:hypothetical protein